MMKQLVYCVFVQTCWKNAGFIMCSRTETGKTICFMLFLRTQKMKNHWCFCVFAQKIKNSGFTMFVLRNTHKICLGIQKQRRAHTHARAKPIKRITKPMKRRIKQHIFSRPEKMLRKCLHRNMLLEIC